jgi:hypothetical protein
MTVVSEGEHELEKFRKAVHDLYLASLSEGLRRRLSEDYPLPPVIPSIMEIGQMFEGLPVHRWFKLHAVASTLNRRPQLRFDPANLAGLASAIRSGDEARDERMPDLLDRFAELAQEEPSGLSPRRWVLFLRTIEEPDTDTETTEIANPGNAALVPKLLVNKPGCNDQEVVPTAGGNATTIRSRFWTDRTLKYVSGFIDPKQWTTCGRPFWKQMAVVTGTESTFTRPGSEGYTAVFEEIVDLPVIRKVTVNLRVRFERSADHVGLDYRLAAKTYPNRQVAFDSGWICATSVTTGPHDASTYVEALKAIRFKDPLLNELPDLACDGGWVQFMINMALDCGGLPAGPPPSTLQVPAPGPGAPSELVANVGKAIDEWVGVATTSLRDGGNAAKSAVGRALAPRHDPHWVNDLVSMSRGPVTTTRATLTAWRRIMTELAKRGGER